MHATSSNHQTHRCTAARLGVTVVGVLVLLLPAATAQTMTVWSENWEGDPTNCWFASAGTWEIGTPTSGPDSAYVGQNAAATVLAGNYSDSAPDSRLIRFCSFLVPAASENPRLRFWHHFNFGGGDFGRVDVSTDGGSTWEAASPTYSGNSSGVWSYSLIDLSAYAGQTLQVGFFFHSQDCCFGDDSGPGWYIDEVAVLKGPMRFPNPQGWEAGIGDWSAERGTWEVGTPTSGPGGAHTGEQVAATNLTGNYSDSASDSRLVSPFFIVPYTSQNPRLQFWHYFNFGGGDYGEVQVRARGGGWETISNQFTGSSSGVYTFFNVSLLAYAGQEVQVAFFFHSQDCCFGDDSGPGWYVDDIRIAGDVFVVPDITSVGSTIIPASGGPLRYRVTLTNPTAQTQMVDAWLMAILPNSSAFGPVEGPRTVTLPPNSSVGPITLTANVPGGAPAGTYAAELRLGKSPIFVGATDSFPFTKLSAVQDAPPVASKTEAIGAYPNPFTTATTIRYEVEAATEVRLAVYDVLGREVAVLAQGAVEAGVHEAAFDAQGLASGVYVWRLVSGDRVETGQLALVK